MSLVTTRSVHMLSPFPVYHHGLIYNFIFLAFFHFHTLLLFLLLLLLQQSNRYFHFAPSFPPCLSKSRFLSSSFTRSSQSFPCAIVFVLSQGSLFMSIYFWRFFYSISLVWLEVSKVKYLLLVLEFPLFYGL